MLRIKDGIDLAELEKYGYREMGNCYEKHIKFGGMLFVDKMTRKITRVHPYDTREAPTEWDIDDIKKARLIEEEVKNG